MWFSATAQTLAEKFGEPEYGIVQLARSLLKRANLQGPPFFPDELACFCGVRQIRNRAIPGHGLLFAQSNGLVIYVNRRYPRHSPQWNAICAHEIGHVLLSEINPRALSPQNQWVDEDERLATRAARELLLPEKAFQLAGSGEERSDGLGLTPRNDKDAPQVLLQQVADIFRAPLRMTAQRLVETGIWRDLVLVWDIENGEALLKLWWPANHPGSSLLRRNASASALFGPENQIQRAIHRDAIAKGQEPLSPRKGVTWFVQSAAFAEYDKSYVLSFVRTGDTPGSVSLV